MSLLQIQSLSKRATPQRTRIPDSAQVQNNVGGYSWAVDDWHRLERFLILGSSNGTYYVTERILLKSNYASALRCLKSDGPRAVQIATEISVSGRSANNEFALFFLALAIAQPNAKTRAAAASALPQICRTGTHLLHFTAYANELRGWGRSLKRAVGNWYMAQSPDDLAYQMIKYRQRDGWSQADVLRRSHPRSNHPVVQAILRWATAGSDAPKQRTITRRTSQGIVTCNYPATPALPKIIQAYERARVAIHLPEICDLIRKHRLPREAIPTQWLRERLVWEALFEQMPLTALIRNLGKLSSLGILSPGSDDARRVVERLDTVSLLHKARIHPFAILLALTTYAAGHGFSSDLTWTPAPEIVQALNRAFYACFANVKPTGKRLLLALDVSGSMHGSKIQGTHLSAAQASAAMALLTANIEPNHAIMAFSQGFVPLEIHASMRLEEVVRKIGHLPFDATDCSLPMQWANQHREKFDGFIVFTDSETWAGPIHPSQALRKYRHEIHPYARCVVVGMTASEFTIADPNDAGMLDVVGFDSASPALISEFLGQPFGARVCPPDHPQKRTEPPPM